MKVSERNKLINSAKAYIELAEGHVYLLHSGIYLACFNNDFKEIICFPPESELQQTLWDKEIATLERLEQTWLLLRNEKEIIDFMSAWTKLDEQKLNQTKGEMVK